jgi:hypothetical protein
MNMPTGLSARIRTLVTTGLIATLVFGLASALRCEDVRSDPPTSKQPGQSDKSKTDSSDKKTKPPIKLSGAELYSMHCNRCHPERYPTERTSAQWKTIMLHMRVRANLPAEQARAILKYLQENSGR